MHDLLGDSRGERLPLGAYREEFQKEFWAIKQDGFWKLERQQTFKEPNNDSWQALVAGRWDEAMRLNEATRPDLMGYHRRIAMAGFGAWRVRVVEKPISPYLQWELHLLRIRHECGGPVRVVEPEQVKELEENGPLPEIYTLGTKVMYQAVYDNEGALEAAIRYNNRKLIQRCREAIRGLYEIGEDLSVFCERDVAVLAPPATVG